MMMRPLSKWRLWRFSCNAINWLAIPPLIPAGNSTWPLGVHLRDVEILSSWDIDFNEVARVIDDAVVEVGLRTTLRGTLKKFPGCIHWHVKDGRESGTLEITLWPRHRRAWFTIQDGRAAPWIDAKMKAMQKAIRQALDR